MVPSCSHCPIPHIPITAHLLVQHRGQAAHELAHIHHHPLGQRAQRAAARPPRQRVGGACCEGGEARGGMG